MADGVEYGVNPRKEQQKNFLLTASTVGVGLFAFAGLLKPWAREVVRSDLAAFISEHYITKASSEAPKSIRADLYRVNKFLQGREPEITRLQALGLFLTRSPLMQHWQWGVERFTPLHIADKLFGGPDLRMMYGPTTKQFQALGDYQYLNIAAKGAQDRDQIFYFGGRLIRAREVGKKHDIEFLPGRFVMYGRSHIDETPGTMQRIHESMLGRRADHRVVFQELARTNARIQGVYKNHEKVMPGAPFMQWEQDLLADLEVSRKAQLSLYTRLTSGHPWHRFMRAFDFGLNERHISIKTKQGKEALLSNIMGIFVPEDAPESFQYESTHRVFKVVKSFDWSADAFHGLFTGGAENLNINTGGMALYHMFERVSAGMAFDRLTPWLALSGLSTTFTTPFGTLEGAGAFISNVLAKRVLPLFAGGFYLGYLNNAIGDWNDGRRPSDVATGLVDKGSLAGSYVKQLFGVNKFAAHVNTLSGGALGILAHPFVDRPVGLSPEELKEEQKHGSTPVRKGRWWFFGSSTPFRGDRIQYWAPNASRQAQAGDINATDTLWGSHAEYYAHAALPTPTHPLAFIRHFITDRYHYERKHYPDRPYPVTSPLFEPTTLHGSLLNPLLGWLLKPQVLMHQQDMPFIVSGKHRGERNPNYKGEAVRSMNEAIMDEAAKAQYVAYVTASGDVQPMTVEPPPGSERAVGTIGDIHEKVRKRERDRAAGIYTTGKDMARSQIRQKNKNTIISSRFAPGYQLENASAPGLYKNQDPNDPLVIKHLMHPADVRQHLSMLYYNMAEIGGIYGFLASSITGYPYSTTPVLADAGNMVSFERMYWDKWNLGGLAPTPTLSEAFRRFYPHKYHTNIRYNPIRNTMPAWLPGAGGDDQDYFLDLLHGDPYAAIPNGEARLPGASYEKLHGIDPMDLSIRSTQVGYGTKGIYGFLTGTHAPFAAYSEEIAEKGGDIHKGVLAQLKAANKGVQDNVRYQWHGIKGSVDAVFNGGAVEIHTVSDKRFRQLNRSWGDGRYRAQLEIDMAALGLKHGAMVYVNRDHPNQEFSVSMTPDSRHLNKIIKDVESAREKVTKEYREGLWGPGQFYSDTEKFSILADVATWSSQYRAYRDFLVHTPDDLLDPGDRERIKEIKQQVTAKKHRYNMAPYMFKYGQLKGETVHVKNVIDNSTFTTDEHPDNPIRLAGVHILSTPDATKYAAAHIYPGAVLRIHYAKDEAQRVAKDTLHTMRSIVYSHGTMLNKEALNMGYGTETDENNPAAIRVRYSRAERFFGSALEYLSHLPIPLIHNKLLPVDSPLELYKRTQVYGKEWQDWQHPFRDYLFPALSAASHQGLAGALAFGTVGYMLGRGPAMIGTHFTFRSKLALGFAMFDVFWGLTHAGSVPDYRKKERDVKSYFDILKYIKYQRLYEQAREKILEHEHRDVGALLDKMEVEGEERKHRIRTLQNEKRHLILEHGREAKRSERVKEINREINELNSYRAFITNLTNEDILAIQYKKVADTTLYGARPGSDLSKVLLAMDPKEREFFQAFLKASGPERKKILKVIPQNERPFLEAAYGMKPEGKSSLEDYFKHHYLPPADWKGWEAGVNLDDYKLVVMKQEGLDLTTNGYWPQDEERVREAGVYDIRPHKSTSGDIRTALENVLTSLGMRDIDIQLQPNGTRHHHINVSVRDTHKKDEDDKKYKRKHKGLAV